MDQNDFFLHGYHNRHCAFNLHDGSRITGVAGTFFPAIPEVLFFVPTPSLKSFEYASRHRDRAHMRFLATKFNVEQVGFAQFLNG